MEESEAYYRSIEANLFIGSDNSFTNAKSEIALGIRKLDVVLNDLRIYKLTNAIIEDAMKN